MANLVPFPFRFDRLLPFPRKRESILELALELQPAWIPAFAGMTQRYLSKRNGNGTTPIIRYLGMDEKSNNFIFSSLLRIVRKGLIFKLHQLLF